MEIITEDGALLTTEGGALAIVDDPAAIYFNAREACRLIWEGYWPYTTIPVLWHSNTTDLVPDVGTVNHWLHIAVEFSGEQMRAFGGGARNNDRVLLGTVVVRLFAARGIGEDDGLYILAKAMEVFRSRRELNISFIGDAMIREEGASEDGNWWTRTAIAAFEFRFRG